MSHDDLAFALFELQRLARQRRKVELTLVFNCIDPKCELWQVKYHNLSWVGKTPLEAIQRAARSLDLAARDDSVRELLSNVEGLDDLPKGVDDDDR